MLAQTHSWDVMTFGELFLNLTKSLYFCIIQEPAVSEFYVYKRELVLKILYLSLSIAYGVPKLH